MAILQEKHFNKIYWPLCLLVFIVVVLRCIYVPFAHDEVATFIFYIQPGDFIPFYAHPDANGHFLTSLTSWLTFQAFGSEPWALRIPCMGAFLLLTYSVFKVNKLIRGVIPKFIFTSAFIISFNFISFYSLCRGYGFSMALMLLGMYYFFVYIRYSSFTHFWKFLLFSQLALSANLTLTIILAVTTAIVIFFQLRQKLFFKIKNIVLLVVHFALLYYWVRYAFFLKESGALYYGEGDNYWKVTFQTLIETIFGSSNATLWLMPALFLFMTGYFIVKLISQKIPFLTDNNFALSFVVFCSLVIVFYLLKLVMHVNYPEDRTGLFFYVFFMIAFCLMVAEIKPSLQMAFIFIPLFFLIHFFTAFNLKVHPWRVYETMPSEFFDILTSEQKKSKRPVTVAGHRVREFFYGFMNYNSPEKLSQITAPEALQMNCDYALAMAEDKPYYEKYYTELAADSYWNFRLLKRIQPVERKILFSTNKINTFVGSGEYYNAFEKLDTTFTTINPVQAEFNLTVRKAPVPFDAWLVLQIDPIDESESPVFIRTPLNLIKYNWNGTVNFTTALVSGNVPVNIKRVVAYLWNIKKSEIDIDLNSFSLYQLNGDGVNIISPAKI